MYTNLLLWSIPTLLLVFTTLTAHLSAFGEETPAKEVIKKKMTSVMGVDDWEDQNAIRQWKEIVQLGEAAYPALIELLDETSDPVAVANILSVFIESKGDKRMSVAATKKLLIRSGSSEAEKVRIAAANALAHIGGATDCEALFPLLDDTAEFVRVSAIRALAKIGDENAALRIERFLNTRKKHASQDEIQKDTSIKEGAKAIEMIKKRLAEAKTPTTSK